MREGRQARQPLEHRFKIMPEPRDPFRFVLLCHQRSGSNALGAILNDDERIWIYGQLFNPFLEYTRRNRALGLRNYPAPADALRHFGQKPPLRPRLEHALCGLLPKEPSLERRLNAFWSTYRVNDAPLAKGYKLHDLQLEDDDLKAATATYADGTILLHRRNLLRGAVSWAYAIKTDVWSHRGALGEQPTHSLDLDEIGWWITKTRDEVGRWRRLLDEAGANWLEMTYEDDVATRKLEPLYDFLGVPYRGKPPFKTKKLATDRYAHVANADEIEARFGSEENGHLFA